MDALLLVFVILAALIFIAQSVLTALVIRKLLAERRSRLAREARQARRYAPIDRPLLP